MAGVAWTNCPPRIVQDLAGKTQSTVDWRRADKQSRGRKTHPHKDEENTLWVWHSQPPFIINAIIIVITVITIIVIIMIIMIL